MTPISLTCPALTGGAFPEIPTMSHTITVTPREPQGVMLVMIMLAQGVTLVMLGVLVVKGLAIVRWKPVRVGGKTIEVGRYRITDVGRRALEG